MITDILLVQVPPTFTADNTQLFITVSAVGVDKTFVNARGAGFDKFIPKDNVKIVSFGLRLPYCFTIAETIPKVIFTWRDGVTIFPIDEINGATGEIEIPLPDVEIPLGIPIAWKGDSALVGSQINLETYSFEVSQVGAPDALNAQVLNIDIFLKVEHTFTMV